MADARLYLFDDRHARDWQPFTLTRPAGELLLGALTLRQRAERVLNLRCVGHVAGEALRGFDEPGAPPVVAANDLPRVGPALFLSSRALLDWSARPSLGDKPLLITIGGEPCGWYAPDGASPPDGFLDEPSEDNAPGALELPGVLLRHVWELIARNPEQIARDVAALHPGRSAPQAAAGVHVLGTEPVVLADGVTVEPGVVLDARHGPIWLDRAVEVRAFSRIAGPAYAGPHTVLLGGPYDEVSAGPHCKLHGEIEATVVLGYSNKAHDGFLGHAYLGQWVNLGALTTNSDLKNNYGSIRLWTPHGEVDTGEMKLGCLLGDHVKTAIGTMLNTGTVVGAGSNVFGGMPPKYVPPFSWCTGASLQDYDVDRFLATAEVVMARRKVPLSPSHRELLREAWRRSRSTEGA